MGEREVDLMNFLYISPTFPKYYYNFCDALKKKGITVLGIGDTPLEKMNQEMKDSFQEYQYLPSLENYDDLMKATAYFIYKYGRIDFIASNI
jgi:tryptophan synthase alpha subunit